MSTHMIPANFLRKLLTTFEDVECELGQDEVCELVSMALDRKVEEAIRELREELGIHE